MSMAGGGDGRGPFDDYSFPLLVDNFDDDVMHLADLPVLANVVAAPALLPQTMDDGQRSSSVDDDLLDWSEMLDSCSEIDGARPPLTCVLLPVHGGASTSMSSTAPAPQVDALECSGCQVLRQVVHSNGFETSKLCIHGGAGVFYHALVDVHRVNLEAPAPALAHHSCIDFRGRGYEWVKHYLTDYAARRAAGGFAVVQDSISAFHDALCTTMASSSHVNDDAYKRVLTAESSRINDSGQHVIHPAAIQPAAASSRINESGQLVIHPAAIHPAAASGPSQKASYTTEKQQPFQQFAARSALAIQREKTAKLQLRDIAPYFDLPIAEAASKLGICVTALKGICRKCGVSRWPYRKVT
ncbi:hypothetical protein GUJ93_ZPchr0009g823 [Zizania palustris]|uniref:RWP-RK domain-containing protein n=1 Tax=Zizania palustris TaxID=103762 RepID=A0A8J5RQI1_ZIZPA|nr:hypothetical protein GUJ93_ZPchr0009g823 [Zizania palustris]KAG8051122.1 hypothetical protein GUJ93_ZPchr0009g823 [Zizania palustris]